MGLKGVWGPVTGGPLRGLEVGLGGGDSWGHGGAGGEPVGPLRGLLGS